MVASNSKKMKLFINIYSRHILLDILLLKLIDSNEFKIWALTAMTCYVQLKYAYRCC